MCRLFRAHSAQWHFRSSFPAFHLFWSETRFSFQVRKMVSTFLMPIESSTLTPLLLTVIALAKIGVSYNRYKVISAIVCWNRDDESTARVVVSRRLVGRDEPCQIQISQRCNSFTKRLLRHETLQNLHFILLRVAAVACSTMWHIQL